ncbi:MAG TPA: aminotransferase class I/II-fold pyridoxal phosphate-dependent enzyme, partial [Leucothrix sp.]|nr:aminotransferase class I/II-fold pyridoxal phosphate-dependent enzyme [Leucothrix sp.]
LTQYTPANGIEELREEIAGFYQSRYGVRISPKRIIITPGATGALQLVLAALLNVGDEVLLPDPGYPCNRHYVELYNGKPIALNVDATTRYQPTTSSIKEHWTDKTRALMLASPANPTGSLLYKEDLQTYLKTIQELAEKSEKRADYPALIVDEIYHGLVYGDADKSLDTALSLENSEQLFVINSFSKYFGMTGWRLGWVVAPESYIEALDRLAQNIFLCAPTPSQYAAVAAFSDESIAIMEQRKQAFEARRDFLLPALRDLGFEIPIAPEGAFYLYANCKKFTSDSMEFASQILEETGVAITPGLDFGSNKPEEFVRFAYTTSVDRLEEAVDRLRGFLK